MKLQKLYDGFEEKELSNIWKKTKFEKGAVKFQSKIVRKGKRALKITIKKGDKKEKDRGCKTSERDELLERKDLGPKEGKSYSYKFSMFLPKSFPIVPVRLVLAQFKQEDEEDIATITNPVLALRYVSGKLYITLQTSKEKETIFKTYEKIKGKWLDFKFNIKFTRKKSGFIQVWMNNKKIIDYKGITAFSEKYKYPKKSTFYFKMGLYRDKMDKPMTAYFDEFYKKEIK